jgi:uncharacterized membrane protein
LQPKRPLRWLWCIIAAAVIAGVLFRAEHVVHRAFWTDESWTALRLSGHTYADVRSLFDGNVHTPSEIMQLQRVSASRGIGDTVAGLASEEPQHPPVFYVLDREWTEIFGNSIAAMRSLALICSLLAMLAIAWFAWELSGSAIVAGIAAALMALSPFFVDYAGQAREYSLWAAFVAATSALLVRALRRPTLARWSLFAGVTTVALYSDVFMAFVLAAQGVYVLALYYRERRAVISFLVAAAVATMLFVPWLSICLEAHGRMASSNAWAFTPYPLRVILEKWAFNAGSVLFDAEYANLRLVPIAAIVLILAIAAAVIALRKETPQTSWLLVALGASVAVPQIAVDFVTHGHTSTIARYMIPLWLVMLVALALFFGRRIEERSLTYVAWSAAFCALLLVAGSSTAINSSAVGWWDNNDDYPWTRMANEINMSSHPLVVSEGHWAHVLVMSHYVKPDTEFLLFKGAPPSGLRVHDAFLMAPSDRTVTALESERYELAPIPIAPYTQASAAIARFHESLESGGSEAFLLRFIAPVAANR